MKKFLFLVVAVATAVAAYFLLSGTRGEGEIITKRFSINNPSRLSSITVTDKFTLIFTNDVPYGVVEVSTYENIIEMASVRSNTKDRSVTIMILEEMNIKGDAKLVARMRPSSSITSFNISESSVRFENKIAIPSYKVLLSEGSHFDAENVRSNEVFADLSNKSTMTIGKTKALIGVAKDKSKITVNGDAKITMELSGGASIEEIESDTKSDTTAEESAIE